MRRPGPPPFRASDQGCGVPAGEVAARVRLRREPTFTRPLHEVIRTCRRDSVITCTEPDPAVRARLRAQTEDPGRGIHVLDADPLDPNRFWATLTGTGTGTGAAEAGRPVGLILGAAPTFHPGSRADAAAVIQRHLQYLPPGSCVVLSHLLTPHRPGRSRGQDGGRVPVRPGPVADRAGRPRHSAEVTAMVAGAQIIAPSVGRPPGLIVPAFRWWPDRVPVVADPVAGHLLGALVAQTPPRRR